MTSIFGGRPGRANTGTAFGLAVLLAVSAIASGTVARPFYVIQSGPSAWTLLDPASIKLINGGPVRRAITITIQRSLTGGTPSQPGYVRTLIDHDCERQETRLVSLSVYSQSAALLVEEANSRSAWMRPAAGTDGASTLRIVCSGGAGNQSVISGESIGHVVSAIMGAWQASQTTAVESRGAARSR
jgi:hypothetical protein